MFFHFSQLEGWGPEDLKVTPPPAFAALGSGYLVSWLLAGRRRRLGIAAGVRRMQLVSVAGYASTVHSRALHLPCSFLAPLLLLPGG